MSTSPVSPGSATPVSVLPKISTDEAVPRRGARWQSYITPILVVILALGILITITRNWNAWEGGKAEQVTDDAYVRGVINHAERYVEGNVHTQGIENFWSLLKRTIKGTYVAIEPFHLFRYLDEQSFRFNTRKGTDADRFVKAAAALAGKRLTYDELIGKGTSH